MNSRKLLTRITCNTLTRHEMLTQMSEWFQLEAIIGCQCWLRPQAWHSRQQRRKID